MKNFIRKKEDFVCGNCGAKIVGDGYTDHCPKCLWGRHVDDEIPGDRASVCRALMDPVGAEFKISNTKFKIKYKCSGCKHTFEVWSADEDDREGLMRLTRN